MISTRNAYWESSRRPLYPKWVWSDGVGHRHFIIDREINSVKTQPLQNNGHVNGLMTKSASFDVVDILHNENMNDTRRMSNDVSPISKKHVGRRGDSIAKQSVHFLKRELNRRLDANQANDGKDVEIYPKILDAKTNQKNPLADRVINWLDLAGLNTLIRAENQNVEKAPVRRVCTTESALQSETRFLAPIRRSESVHMLSLTFNDNDILNQGQNDKSTFQSFSSAYRASRAIQAAHQNLLHHKVTRHSASGSSRNSNKFADGTDSTRGQFGSRSRHQQGTTNRKSSSASGVSNDEIEKQYRSLVQRQILEKSSNLQASRRQLHIFMPSLPDKNLLAPGGLGVEDGDTSYLSTIMSSGL